MRPAPFGAGGAIREAVRGVAEQGVAEQGVAVPWRGGAVAVLCGGAEMYVT